MDVKTLFDYRDGQLYWRTTEHGREIGSSVGRICSSGYVQVGVLKKSHKVHRLVWMWHYGSISKGLVIDHINQVHHDNRIENLRLVTSGQNAQNRKTHSNNRSRYKGVNLKNGRWAARIMLEGRSHFLGTFNTAENAAQAYNFAAYELHGEFRRENIA